MVKEGFFSEEDIITPRDLDGDTCLISIINSLDIQLLQIIPHFLDSTFEDFFCATPSLVNINFCMGYVVMNTYHIPC